MHTPGPWDVDSAEYCDVIAPCGRIAMLDHDGGAHDVEANARLIAAAPCLLEVLMDAREAWLDGRIDDVEGILTGDVCSIAIARATGA